MLAKSSRPASGKTLTIGTPEGGEFWVQEGRGTATLKLFRLVVLKTAACARP